MELSTKNSSNISKLKIRKKYSLTVNLNIEFVLSYRRDSIVGLANVFPHVLTSDLGDIED